MTNQTEQYIEKTRFAKNKTKGRSHQRRQRTETDIAKELNKENRKMAKKVKEYKRKNGVERNPLITECRGEFETTGDYCNWLLHKFNDVPGDLDGNVIQRKVWTIESVLYNNPSSYCMMDDSYKYQRNKCLVN